MPYVEFITDRWDFEKNGFLSAFMGVKTFLVDRLREQPGIEMEPDAEFEAVGLGAGGIQLQLRYQGIPLLCTLGMRGFTSPPRNRWVVNTLFAGKWKWLKSNKAIQRKAAPGHELLLGILHEADCTIIQDVLGELFWSD